VATPIPEERLVALRKMAICSPALAWLAAPGRTYEDLGSHPEGPHWAFLAARFEGADVPKLQQIVMDYGTPELRKKFAEHIPGADKKALLSKRPGR
jgi:hypothetical protein